MDGAVGDGSGGGVVREELGCPSCHKKTLSEIGQFRGQKRGFIHVP